MKYSLISLLFLISSGVEAQIAMPIKEWTKTENISTEDISIYEAPSLNNDLIHQTYNNCSDEDCNFYAKQISANINPLEKGTWTTLEDGRKIWRIKIYSPTAFGFHILSDNFRLPHGAALYFYNENKTNIYGAYTAYNNKENKHFSSSAIYENPLIVELDLPNGIDEDSWDFNINALGYIFTSGADIGRSHPCQKDVTCQPWWNDWCNQIRSVVKIGMKTEVKFTSDPYTPGEILFRHCTGVIINDLDDGAQDFSQLKILTAAHCAIGKSNAATTEYRIDYFDWIIYYNFQYNTCGSISNLANDKMTTLGVELIYNTEDPDAQPMSASISDACPDIALLKVTDEIPFQYNLYYSGWTIADTDYKLPSLNTTFIHHPMGDLKKVGEGTIFVQNREWDKDCWKIDNTIGFPQGVSSGCPFYNNEGKKIIGIQSHYEDFIPSSCDEEVTNDRASVGKLGKAWSMGLKNHIGSVAGTDGADPIQSCIQDMSISGFLYPSADWQSKTDIKIQAFNIKSPDNINLYAKVVKSAVYITPTVYADYTFQATKQVKLIPGFSVERGNNFKATIAPCDEYTTDCGINYEARPISPSDELTFEEEKRQGFGIAPNPTTGQLSISMPEAGGVISVYDALGRLCLQEKTTATVFETNISHLQTGIYLVQWRLGKEIRTEKIVLR